MTRLDVPETRELQEVSAPTARPGGRVASRGGGRGGTRRLRDGRPGRPREGGRPAVVDAVVEVAAALRSGLPAAVAWSARGVRVLDGLPHEADLVGRLGAEPRQARAVVAAARCALVLGAGQAEVLDRVAASLVAEAEAEAARRAALAGPAATARLLLWLPVIGLGLGVVLGARPWEVLLDGATGTALGAVGVLLGVVGRWWSQRLLRVAETAGTP